MKYVNTKSLTWWAGFGLICCGVYLNFAGDFQTSVGNLFGEVIANFIGDRASPAQYILSGLGLIGIRSKLDRL